MATVRSAICTCQGTDVSCLKITDEEWQKLHVPFLNTLAMSAFGLDGCKDFQLTAIRAGLQGEHSFVVAATGGGKSLCYQLFATYTQGIVLVVSPLQVLIKD